MGRKLVFVGGERRDNSKMYRYDQVIIHPKYTPSTTGVVSNDVALLRLQTPLTFSAKIKPVKLPTTVSTNTAYVFIGRGRDETGIQTKSLMKMDVIKLGTHECLKEIGNAFYRHFQEATIICAIRQDRKPGVCMGDSGSPLVQNGVVIGVASFIREGPRKGSCSHTNIGYYTNVAAFVPWIKAAAGIP